MIDRTTLGRSALSVPRVVLGTMTFGAQNSESGAHSQLDYALERGIDLVDTAEIYPVPARIESCGSAERIIGNWLAGRRRDRVLIATKVAGPARGEDIVRRGPRARLPALGPADIVHACEASLARLRTDYIDLLQLHWPARYVPAYGEHAFDPARDHDAVPIEEQLRAIDRLIRDGKVRHFGLANETPWGISAFARTARSLGVPAPVSCQHVFNLLSRGVDGGLSEACMREDVSLLACSPLAMGLLTGKYLGGARPPKARFTLHGERWPHLARPAATAAIARYADIAAGQGITPLQLAIAFVHRHPMVGATVVGATSIDQLRHVIDAFDTRLSPEALSAIEAVHADAPNPLP